MPSGTPTTAVAPTALLTHTAYLTVQPNAGPLARRVGAYRRAHRNGHVHLVDEHDWPIVAAALVAAAHGTLTPAHLCCGQHLPADWCAYLAGQIAVNGEAISRAITGDDPQRAVTASRINGGWLRPLTRYLQVGAAHGGIHLT